MKLTREKSEAFDGIRGIAILLVFAFHAASAGAFKENSPLHAAMMSGWLGVDLFFALSGYLITASATRTKKRHPAAAGYFQDFYKKRAFRILPAHFLWVGLVIFLANLLATDSDRLTLLNERAACLVLLCLNMQVALTSAPATFGLNHIWSLAVEAQIYIVWGVAAFCLSRRHLLTLSIALIAVSFGWRLFVALGSGNWIWNYFSTPTRLDSFALGAVCFLAMERLHLRVGSLPVLIPAVGLFILGVISGGVLYNDPKPQAVGILLMGLMGAATILHCASGEDSFLKRALEARWLVTLGTISYSFYLTHFIILGTVWVELSSATGLSLGGSIAQDLILTVALLIVCTLVATVSYRYVEKPFMMIGNSRSRLPA